MRVLVRAARGSVGICRELVSEQPREDVTRLSDRWGGSVEASVEAGLDVHIHA